MTNHALSPTHKHWFQKMDHESPDKRAKIKNLERPFESVKNLTERLQHNVKVIVGGQEGREIENENMV